MRILTVVGARPQFVKAAVVSREIATRGGAIVESILHTGQHFDENMSDVFFEQMHIPRPTHQLSIGGLPHGAMTGRMIEGIESLLREERPDWVLVYGDTNSTMAGALAAVKLHVPVAHVEAGLRSFNRRMPEEINRVVTDHVSSLLFAPTEAAVANLAREGIDAARVRRSGDVMFDASRFYGRIAADRTPASIAGDGLVPRGYGLVTLHRAENTDDPARIGAIVDALRTVAKRLPLVLPLHPRTRGTLDRLGLLDRLRAAVRLLDPVGYLEMVALERDARVIVTDSGGVQKEAYFFDVPCVTLRDETEWVELIEAGANRLAPPSAGSVAMVAAVDAALDSPREFVAGLYGDGAAARQIVDALVDAHGAG
jgi:UDP-GlcNAc3NAcA epimerase